MSAPVPITLTPPQVRRMAELGREPEASTTFGMALGLDDRISRWRQNNSRGWFRLPHTSILQEQTG